MSLSNITASDRGWYEEDVPTKSKESKVEILEEIKKEPIKLNNGDFYSYYEQVKSAYKLTPEKNLGDIIVLLEMVKSHLN